MQRLNNVAPQKLKDEAATKADDMFQLLLTKKPRDIEEYLLNNMSAVITMSDAEIDAYAATLTTVAKRVGAIGTIAKDVKFLASTNMTLMKIVIMLARKI